MPGIVYVFESTSFRSTFPFLIPFHVHTKMKSHTHKNKFRRLVSCSQFYSIISPPPIRINNGSVFLCNLRRKAHFHKKNFPQNYCFKWQKISKILFFFFQRYEWIFSCLFDMCTVIQKKWIKKLNEKYIKSE